MPEELQKTTASGSETPFEINDPRVLRAIAHPVRMRILDLFDAGPQRAADIAVALAIPANQASFHLRQLAKYGLVVEAPEEARDKRDRVWKPASRVINVDTEAIKRMPGGEAALQIFRERWVDEAHQLIDRISRGHIEGSADSMAGARTSLHLLTKAEAKELLAELDAVFERWKGRAAAEGARSYEVLVAIGPEEL